MVYPPKTTALFLLVLTMICSACANAKDPSQLDELIVTATKSSTAIRDISASASVITEEELSSIRHTHITEVLHHVPGVWISRGNGQEHLTAIRSPVLTGAGSCGAFVIAQDGISVRAPGFCNVNELFESASELASRIEVIRGPGSSIYGSDALHGVINVLTPEPSEGLREISMETGQNQYYRGKFSASTESLRLDLSATTDGGYKDESGFDQQKLLLRYDTESGNTRVSTRFSYTNLNQETAGFIQGRNAYKDAGQKRDNPNPEAYRDARSFRLVTEINRTLEKGEITIKPYLRSVDMTFLQHFLPGQAVEENGHHSLGIMLQWHQNSWWQLGFELEITDGFLKEFQADTITGSAFLAATIPAGQHYDYDVTAKLAGAFLSFSYPVSEDFNLNGSIRYQYTDYDYDNQMIDGRTQADGTPCGFGGCRFNRPADRSDNFGEWSPNLGFVYDWRENQQWFGSISRGFRAPQATELYRLQASQSVSNIDPVSLDAIELGFRGSHDASNYSLNYGVTLYAMEKDNFIFRDTNRQNVDNGETSHRGVEFNIGAELTPEISLALNLTRAKHTYENNPALTNTSIKGNRVDTAPDTLGAASLKWQFHPKHDISLEWVHVGEYFEDAQNENEYEGHDLLNLRGQWQFSSNVTMFYRVMNLADRDYAERADFAFGSDRYFVGTPRSLFFGVTTNW